MKAVILAAGVGSRLMPLTRNTPKSLLDLGDGFTLLERQLQSLGACGIRDISIVTGYKSHQIEAKVQDYHDFNINIVFNPFYKLSNNLPSAWMGLRDLKQPAMIINGDDLFKPQVVEGLLKSEEEITMVISRKAEYDDDDMKVITEGDHVKDVGKDISPQEANGESIGMIMFRGAGLRTYQDCLDKMVRVDENLQIFYLAAFRQLFRDHVRVNWHECNDSDWAEVDFHPDLEIMRQGILSDLPAWD